MTSKMDEFNSELLKDLQHISISLDKSVDAQDYVEDLKKLLVELNAALPPVFPLEHEKSYKWKLSSTLVNSLEGLRKSIGYWGASIDFFNDLFKIQVDILDALEKNQRVVINKTERYRGTSTAFLLYTYHFARQNPGKEILIISKHDYNSRKLYDVFKQFVVGKCYTELGLITLYNGTKVRFASEDAPAVMHSKCLDLIILDDAGELTNLHAVLNDCLMQLVPEGKIAATKWNTFGFQGWKEVVV